jgi:hypothetical protein
MFLLAHRKGQLAKVLARVRQLALSDNHINASPRSSPLHSQSLSISVSPERLLSHNVKVDSKQREDPSAFENYRRLLWYWREYYLRRGRDRLSLEFSSHIPFKAWNEVVDLLVRDDGSTTALLVAPIKLPKSPYLIAPRPVSSTSEFIHNSTRPNFVSTSQVLYDSVD